MLLSWDDGTVDGPVREQFLREIDNRLSGKVLDAKVRSLRARSAINELFLCDGLALPAIVLEWERQTVLQPGFGGYATFGRWYHALEEALRLSAQPETAPTKTRDLYLLNVVRDWTRFYVGTMMAVGAAPRLGIEDWRLPNIEIDALKLVEPSDVPATLQDIQSAVDVVVEFLSTRGIDVPDAPRVNPLHALLLTQDLEKHIKYSHLIIDILSNNYLRQDVAEHIIPQRLPKQDSAPIEEQVAQFRRNFATILDDVLIGQRYVINSYVTPRLVLRPFDEETGPIGETVLRKEFKDSLATYLKKVESGRSYIIRRGPTVGELAVALPQASAVLAEPPAPSLVAERVRQHRESQQNEKRTRRRDGRAQERLAKLVGPDTAAKLRLVEGLTVEQVTEAIRLLVQSERK
jgi:hypothetical protein